MKPKEIRELREYHELSIRALAKRLGVSKNTLLNWEHGRTSPRGPALEALRDFAGWDTMDRVHQRLQDVRERQRKAFEKGEVSKKLAHEAKGLELIVEYFDQMMHTFADAPQREVEVQFEKLLFALLELVPEEEDAS